MGIAKYYEDNWEITTERLTQHLPVNNSHTPVCHFVCPYCDLVEYTQDKLFEHIKNEHNITHPVIVLNGKVVNQSECNVVEIESLNVFTYGFNDRVYLDKELCPGSKTGNVNITNVAKKAFNQNGTIEISVSDKKVLIKRFSTKAVRVDMVHPIIEDWQMSIGEGIMISLDLPEELNEVECEYLKAFYNYFVACISEGRNKRDRYYDAFAILGGFSPISSLGICVLKAIAFRFNWIDSLKHLCNLANDDFNAVCDFYEGASCESLKAIITERENQLYIEDDIRECIDAITDYMFGDLNAVRSYINKYDLNEIADKNQKDRLLVLLSKLAVADNNLQRARYYNDKILTQELRINF